MRALPFGKIQRPAAMRQPAHDHPIGPDHLLAVDAEILARLVRPARDHETPGDERPDIARPAGLDRQARQIHLAPFPHLLLAGRRTHGLRRHVQHLAHDWQAVPGIAQPLGRLGFLQKGQRVADLAQRGQILRAHGQCHTARGAEEIAQDRDLRVLGPLEQQRRPAGAQHPVADLGHLEVRIDRRGDAFQLPLPLQMGHELPQIAILQCLISLSCCRHAGG